MAGADRGVDSGSAYTQGVALGNPAVAQGSIMLTCLICVAVHVVVACDRASAGGGGGGGRGGGHGGYGRGAGAASGSSSHGAHAPPTMVPTSIKSTWRALRNKCALMKSWPLHVFDALFSVAVQWWGDGRCCLKCLLMRSCGLRACVFACVRIAQVAPPHLLSLLYSPHPR